MIPPSLQCGVTVSPPLTALPSSPSPARRLAAPANRRPLRRESYTSHIVRAPPCDQRPRALLRFRRTLLHPQADFPKAPPDPPNNPAAPVPARDSSPLSRRSPWRRAAPPAAKIRLLPASPARESSRSPTEKIKIPCPIPPPPLRPDFCNRSRTPSIDGTRAPNPLPCSTSTHKNRTRGARDSAETNPSPPAA